MSKFKEKIKQNYCRRKGSSDEVKIKKFWSLPVIPSKFGIMFVITLLLCFVWAGNYKIGAAYFFIFFGAGIFLFSVVITVKQLQNLEIKLIKTSACFAEESAFFKLQIKNPDKNHHLDLIIRNQFNQTNFSLAPNEEIILELRQETYFRGRQEIDILMLCSTFPFGFFITWHWFKLWTSVLVYPKAEGIPLGEANSFGEGIGENLASNFGDDELSHLRPYVKGDSLARVAWKYQRQGELLFKQLTGTAQKRFLFSWHDCTGDTETRLSQLCLWIIEAEKIKLSFALELPQGSAFWRSDFSASKEHYEDCLQRLALFEVK